MRGLLALFATIVVAVVVPSVAHAAAPPNDAFSSPETIAGTSGAVYGTTVDATSEPGEPASMPLNHSIWYEWTAPSYGNLSFNTGGSTWAWVFTGDALDALSMKINGQSYGFVSVRPGVTYRIALDDWYYLGGPTQFTWTFSESPPPPANDDWANAQRLEGSGGTVALNTLGATREPCDSAYAFRAPVWYSWTATADGQLTVQGIVEERGTIVGVYTGESACTLVEVARSGGDPSAADVVAGTTYWIGVDTWTDAGGPASFSWSFATVTRPINDAFANAQAIGPEYRGELTGSTRYATPEPGEWTPFFGRTVWYTWTPAESGIASINVQLADVVVYGGPELGSLTTVAYGNSTFAVTGGTTYHVQVSGGDMFILDWLLQPDSAPKNDNFANAQPLYGAAGSVESTNRLATMEAGEPSHGGKSNASVWFTWTADEDGDATFHVDSSFWTIHAVYVGDSVDSLTPVEQTRDVAAQVVTFGARAGTTYRIAVDGRAGGAGVFWLDWSFLASGGGGGGDEGSAPEATSDSFYMDEDDRLTLNVDDLLANDVDADADAITFVSVATEKKGNGTVKLGKGGRIMFTPRPDFNGAAFFSYKIVDATGLEATGRVDVEVAPVNDAPTLALSADMSGVSEGAPVGLFADGQDVDGDELTYDWSTSGGEISGDGSSGTLVVDDGPASVVVQVFVTDGVEAASAWYEVTVTNAAPTVEAEPASGVWGLPVTLTGRATDPSRADTEAGLSPAWSIGGASLSGLIVSPVFDEPGSYSATLTVTDKDGEGASVAVPVEIEKRNAALSYVGASSAPFGFGSLAARFADTADAATARTDGRAIALTAGDVTFKAPTAGGVATAAVGPALLPGTHTVHAAFAGDALYLPATGTGALTVVNSLGKATGDVVLNDGTHLSFAVAGRSGDVTGSLTGGTFASSELKALGISGHAVWFAGKLADGRSVVAYAEDNGEPGRDVDVFRLWIAGQLQDGSGVIAGGNVQLHS